MDVRTVFDARRFSPEKMQKVNLFATPQFFCDLYCFEPKQAQKPHSHSKSDKVYIVLEGRGRFQVGDQNEELGPGQAVIAQAGIDHGVENATDERLVLLVFITPPPSHA